ncbi:MAG TPA: urease subunit alpha [Candidatus Limnocylindrales bacterium]|nr:urease subunit alpha [Candidatus Limnocylindrales bacterium]
MTRDLSPLDRLARYGPTVGDRVRLADTDLWVRVGEDRQAPGDEPQWGYAKNLRPRMTQAGRASDSELDVVVAGGLVIDATIGVVKADIGIKDGRIVGVGRAGNPAISDGIELEIGPHTEPIMAYGLIATPGAVDSHVHLITRELMPAALSGGVTTLITAGFAEPPWAMERTLAAMTEWPLNVGVQACARSEAEADLEALLAAGAVGFKIHEDYGAYPELIDATLQFAEMADVAVALHTDGLHESAELEDTVAAIAGRTVHAYHVEGTGGGHVPDLLGLVREPNILCSSTTPTLPYGINTAAEHVAMIVLNHGGSMAVAADVALAAERIHQATMAAEGPLHDLGAIAMINSDSQGMGRIMESVRRTFQLASVLKRWRGSKLPRGERGEEDDTERVLRYLAKVTIEPAITHGLVDHVGSLRPGRLADIVLWKPAWFGAKPELVLKSGYAAWGPLGEGNATVERAEPTRYRPDWGGTGEVAARLGVTFTSTSAAKAVRDRTRAGRAVVPIGPTRGLSRADLWLNRSAPAIVVDPSDGWVTLDDHPLAIDPIDDLPLSRRYFLR